MHRDPSLAARPAIAFGVFHILSATLIVLGVFVGLPARDALVDAIAGVVAALLLGSGAALALRLSVARALARVTAAIALLVGLALVATLALTASYLLGIYGPVGRGGALILVLVAALAIPYLIAVPCVELVWLAPRPPPSPGAPRAKT